MVKKELVIIYLSLSIFTCIKTQDVDISKFIGVWYAENSKLHLRLWEFCVKMER